MNKLFCLKAIIFLIFSGSITAQNKDFQQRGDLRIMFYNTENFFDTIDDPRTSDNDFLPGSKLKWNRNFYFKKIKHIYQTVAAVGENSPPEIIGFSEIENRNVLSDLILHSPLEKFNYKVIHKDSPDLRGIDVGLIYRPDKVKCLKYSFFEMVFLTILIKRRGISYTSKDW